MTFEGPHASLSSTSSPTRSLVEVAFHPATIRAELRLSAPGVIPFARGRRGAISPGDAGRELAKLRRLSVARATTSHQARSLGGLRLAS